MSRTKRFVDDVTVLDSPSVKTLNEFTSFFEQASRTVSFREALIEAGVDAEYVVSHANVVATRAKNNGVLSKLNITEDDARIIAGYTVEVPSHRGVSMYTVLNSTLRGNRSVPSMTKIRNLFVLFLSSLRKLPRVTRPVVYRGINVGINLDRVVSRVVSFMSFASTSCDRSVANGFVGSGSGTLLILRGDCIGYDLSELSEFPLEREVLLEPETRYMVSSVVHPGITCADCQYVMSSPILQSITPMRGLYNYYTMKYKILGGDI